MKHLLRWIAFSMLALVTAHPALALVPEPAALATRVTLRIGYVKVGHLAPMLAVADELKKLNVDVRPTEFVRYADVRTALLSGSIDVGSIGPGDLAIALAQGNKSLIGLTGVASSPKYLVVRKGVKIDSWKDIAGKRIGIAPGSAVWFQWAATLTEKGIPYDTFKPINIQGGGSAFVQALRRGDIDAFVCWEPFESQVIGDGTGYFAKAVEYDNSRAVGAELGLLATTHDAIGNKRPAIRLFLWSYLHSEDQLAHDNEVFAQAYARFTGLPIAVTRGSARVIKLGGVIDGAQLKAQAAEFYKLGVIPKDVSGEIGSYYDDSLVKSLQ